MNTDLLQRIRLLRPIDDILFEVLADDKDFCTEMLRTILEDPGLIVKEVTVQRSERNIYGRSVRLDALCVLGDGSLCNIEVQRANNDDHLRRVRYNASVITAKETEVGARFEKIPNLIVIYITESDFLKGGKTIYHVKSIVLETGDVLDDGLERVFVNTAVDDRTDIAEYMRCMTQTEVESKKYPVFTKRLHEIKNTKGGQGTMCKVIEEYAQKVGEEQRRKGHEEGLRKGQWKGRREERRANVRVLAQTLMELKNISEEEALKEAESRILQAQK